MTTEQLLINSWRTLSGDEQKVVVEFVEFLKTRSTQNEYEAKKIKRRLPPPDLVGKVKIVGDIISPIVDETDWECLK